jgi:hypothetical protein
MGKGFAPIQKLYWEATNAALGDITRIVFKTEPTHPRLFVTDSTEVTRDEGGVAFVYV